MHRHSPDCAADLDKQPPGFRSRIDSFLGCVTPRRLILLECGIIRHAPFTQSGHTIWDLLPEQSWFEASLPSARVIRAVEASIAVADVHNFDRSIPGMTMDCLKVETNGHIAIKWLEEYADGASEDRLLLAQHYFTRAEIQAETDHVQNHVQTCAKNHEAPDIGYGIASWLRSLIGYNESWRYSIFFYLLNCPGVVDGYSSSWPVPRSHRDVALQLIEDIFGRPNYLDPVDPILRTDLTTSLAMEFYRTGDFSGMPVLADALEEAGCQTDDVLRHCREHALHARGCWVVDEILGKS